MTVNNVLRGVLHFPIQSVVCINSGKSLTCHVSVVLSVSPSYFHRCDIHKNAFTHRIALAFSHHPLIYPCYQRPFQFDPLLYFQKTLETNGSPEIVIVHQPKCLIVINKQPSKR